MKPLFYLLSLKISGIKNIEVPIELNFYKKTINNSDFDPEKYRIKAIYGENGSGKTAIITAVKILQNFLTDKNYLALRVYEFTGKMLGEACADFAAFSSPEAFVFFSLKSYSE